MNESPATSDRTAESSSGLCRFSAPTDIGRPMTGQRAGEAVLASDYRIVLAWLLVVATSGVAALLFTYDQIWWGSVILYYTFVVDLSKAYPESKVHDRDAEMLVTIGVVIGTLFLHSVLLHVIKAIALDLGAAQVIALAALASRGYAILRAEGSLEVALENPDPITHPFTTVGSITTFTLGILGLAGRSLLEVVGAGAAESGSALGFFLLLSLGASAGLAAYFLDMH